MLHHAFAIQPFYAAGVDTVMTDTSIMEEIIVEDDSVSDEGACVPEMDGGLWSRVRHFADAPAVVAAPMLSLVNHSINGVLSAHKRPSLMNLGAVVIAGGVLAVATAAVISLWSSQFIEDYIWPVPKDLKARGVLVDRLVQDAKERGWKANWAMTRLRDVWESDGERFGHHDISLMRDPLFLSRPTGTSLFVSALSFDLDRGVSIRQTLDFLYETVIKAPLPRRTIFHLSLLEMLVRNSCDQEEEGTILLRLTQAQREELELFFRENDGGRAKTLVNKAVTEAMLNLDAVKRMPEEEFLFWVTYCEMILFIAGEFLEESEKRVLEERLEAIRKTD